MEALITGQQLRAEKVELHHRTGFMINQRGNIMSAQTETLHLTITGLPAGTKSALEEIGRKIGKSVEDYLRGVIENEFDEIIERERQAIWEEKQGREE
jgi:hypothetical protein